jgi:hypothetical protein
MNTIEDLAKVRVARAMADFYRLVGAITCAKSFHDVHCEISGPVGVECRGVKRPIADAVRDGGWDE